ncbi:unnamed protein product, partial [Choristocarpus tenellus]
FAWSGYGLGVHAPGRGGPGQPGNRATEPYLVVHNMLLAHLWAAQAFRCYQKNTDSQVGVTMLRAKNEGEIGMAINSDWGEPYDPGSEADCEAAKKYVEFWYGWAGDPLVLGHYPESMVSALG